MRHLIRRLFPHLDQNPASEQQGYAFDTDLLASLQALADSKQRPVEEITENLLSRALQEQQIEASYQVVWRKLSPRLQQITALICLGYTNGEIAQHLNISAETVKTHIRIIHIRFNTHSKIELRDLLETWDFTPWK